MSRLFDDSSFEYLSYAGAVISSRPLAMLCWVNNDDGALDNQMPFTICGEGAGSDDRFGINFNTTTGVPDGIRCTAQGTSFAYITTDVDWVAGTWCHACAIFVTATDSRILINGGGKKTTATNTGPVVGLDITMIGAEYRASANPQGYTSGHIAECAVYDLSVWPGATDSDKADAFEKIVPSLAKGFSPLLFPLGLVSYWPLVRGLEDRVSGYDMIATVGTVVSPHLGIIYPGELWVPHKAVGGVVYQELNLAVSANAEVTETDTHAMVDTGKAVQANATVIETDMQQMVDTGKEVSAAAAVSCTEIKVVFELNLTVTAAGSVVATDAHTMIETGKSVIASASPAVIDAQTMVEVGNVSADALVDIKVPVWVGIDSSYLDSHCGDTAGATLVEALNAEQWWQHDEIHIHEIIFDLGSTQLVTGVRGRSQMIYDPIDVDIFVSDDKENFGDAVAIGVSTWQDTASWKIANTTPKSGRYVQLIINDTQYGATPGKVSWGRPSPPYFSILDVRVEKADVMSMIETEREVSADGSAACIDSMGLLAHIAAFMILRQCT